MVDFKRKIVNKCIVLSYNKAIYNTTSLFCLLINVDRFRKLRK